MDANCTKCRRRFDGSTNPRCMVPCSKRHITCFKCLDFMFTPSLPEPFSKDCWMFGNLCKVDRPHIICPFPNCGDVLHLKGDNIEGIYKYPETQKDLDRLENDRLDIGANLKNSCTTRVQLCKKDLEELDKNISELNEICQKIRIAKIVASSVGLPAGGVALAGGIMAATGFLAPIGVPMIIAGGVVAGVAGAGVGAASIADYITTKKKVTEATQCLNVRLEDFCDLYEIFNDFVILEVMRTKTIEQAPKIVAEGISRTVLQTGSLVRLGFAIGSLATDVGEAALKGATVALRAVSIFGSVISGLGMLIDGITIALNANDMIRKNPAKQAESIEKLKVHLQDIIAQLEDIQRCLDDADQIQ